MDTQNQVIAALQRISEIPEEQLINEIRSLTHTVREMNYDECRAAGDFLILTAAHQLSAGQSLIQLLISQLQMIAGKERIARLVSD